VDNVNIEGFNVSLAVRHFARNPTVAKMLRHQKTNIFQLFDLFQRSVTRSKVALAAHQAIKNQAQSVLFVCTQFQHSSLLCFESSVDFQNLVKIKGVPELFKFISSLVSFIFDLVALNESNVDCNTCTCKQNLFLLIFN
jgi:hypothetical protein